MIFVDTSYWYAVRARDDTRSAAAQALAARYASARLVTTNHVVGETWTLLRNRRSHAAAVDFVDRIERSPRVDILRVEPAEEAAAWKWLRRHDERAYTFVDATSFAVMHAHGITQALAFDGDFAAAGFELLAP